ERTRKRLHTVTCYHPCLTQEWRDTDWFKTAFPTNSKTASLHPECKQIFAVHAPSAYTHNSTPFSCQWVGPPGPWKLKIPESNTSLFRIVETRQTLSVSTPECV